MLGPAEPNPSEPYLSSLDHLFPRPPSAATHASHTIPSLPHASLGRGAPQHARAPSPASFSHQRRRPSPPPPAGCTSTPPVRLHVTQPSWPPAPTRLCRSASSIAGARRPPRAASQAPPASLAVPRLSCLAIKPRHPRRRPRLAALPVACRWRPQPPGSRRRSNRSPASCPFSFS